MAKNKGRARQDLTQGAHAFRNSPFAQLGDQLGDLPSLPPPATVEEVASTPFRVERTRKGGWPLRVEKRGGGKLVTVLERATGDTQLLLKQLQKHCNAGGTLRDGSLEIQGDQRVRIEQFLASLA